LRRTFTCSNAYQWAKTWLVDFNPKKTKALISNNINIPELNIRFNDESVELVDNHKHLGVTFVSANSLAKLPKLSAMSLIYNKNNKGPSTDPWGTPALTRPESDSSLLTNTNCLLPLK
jgi:hypothetical protein